jgi:predicted nucleic acid-binding protein
LQRFLSGRLSINERRPDGHAAAAWAVAEEFGWAKTYDAEYVALAKSEGCRLVTLGSRLRRGADRLGFVVTPAELS